MSHEVINALYRPNKSDSSVAFCREDSRIDAIATQDIFLVWSNYGRSSKPGSDFMGQGGKNIAGFTFLGFRRVERVSSKTTYTVGTGRLLKMRYCLVVSIQTTWHAGYSPSEASRRWATLDDHR